MGTCIWPVKPKDRKCRYCKLVHCEDRNKKGASKLGTVAPTMRTMEVGQRIELDAIDYSAARTARYRIHEDKGWEFSIFMRDKSVFVERIC